MELAISPQHGCFPSTRYQGSKRKLVGQILQHLEGLQFDTALDAFGGTGAVSHALKCLGKSVTYNDVLRFNHQIGLALIENDDVRLTDNEIVDIGTRREGVEYVDFVERTFEGIYFTASENRWLDIAVGNIRTIACQCKRAMCWFSLFQSALAKRPYNLFHRKNLYMRTAPVARGFGNKTTWDRAFDEHFRSFATMANAALVDSRGRCRSVCHDVLAIPGEYDLVYIDPPYINARGVGVDYHHFYHFLEGMVDYSNWPRLIDRTSKHRRLKLTKSNWCNAESVAHQFRETFQRFRDSVLVVSYRGDGIPSIAQVRELLGEVKAEVRVHELARYQYALSTNLGSSEVLLIAV